MDEEAGLAGKESGPAEGVRDHRRTKGEGRCGGAGSEIESSAALGQLFGTFGAERRVPGF